MSRRLIALSVCALATSACVPGNDPLLGGSPSSQRTLVGVAAKPLAQRAGVTVVADELVVETRDLDDAALEALAYSVGAELVGRGERTGVAVFRFADDVVADSARAALASMPGVGEVRHQTVLRGAVDGAGAGTSPGLRAAQWNLAALGIDPELGLGTASAVTVAVIDSGVAYEDRADATGVYVLAPDLATTAFTAGYDFVNGDDHPNDDHGHGTHIAGVIAASSGIRSIAPGVTVMPIKVLDAENSGTELGLAEGIRYAVDHDADVINMSLAFPSGYFPSIYLQAAIEYAIAHDVVMVAAAGNDGADAVTYPAAFRDVIAVGASAVSAGDWLPAAGWAGAGDHVHTAPYSNRGLALDVLAPGGDLSTDIDADGVPEGILAQTFTRSAPQELSYYLFAGTSQAAAEVTGVVALMLDRKAGLGVDRIRALLGATATSEAGPLTAELGRGHVRADAAVAAASLGDDVELAGYRVSLFLALRRADGDSRRAAVELEVLDGEGNPAPAVHVWGTFTGAVHEPTTVVTDGAGRAVVASSAFTSSASTVGFQVEAVGSLGADGWSIERPRGLVHIDSRSLELLMAFADRVGGAGAGTSPGALPGTPILIRAPSRAEDPAAIPSLLLANMSWALATVPMAVVIDEAWLLSTHPGSADQLVVSSGTGLGSAPHAFDEISSFPTPVVAAAPEVASIPLALTTFAIGSGAGTSPGFVSTDPLISLDTGATRSQVDGAMADMFAYWRGALAAGASAGTSPGFAYDPERGLTPAQHHYLDAVIRSYVRFGASSEASPVASYGSALEAAGLGLVPLATSGGAGAGSTAFSGDSD
jgi:hypothetical protein